MRIGVDPGLVGAIALLDSKLEFLDVADMPIRAYRKNKHQISWIELSKILDRWKYKYHENEPWICFLEDVNPMPHEGVSSSFNFGGSFHGVQAVLEVMRIPYLLVTSHVWKKRAGLIGAEKDKARTIAQQLYPNASLARKKDIGRADALLIARFGEKHV